MQEGVTDSGFQALAGAGCGKSLKSLILHGGFFFSSSFLANPALRVRAIWIAGLKEGVTDSSFQALAHAGCGKKLTSLHLDGGLPLPSLFFFPLFRRLHVLHLSSSPLPSSRSFSPSRRDDAFVCLRARASVSLFFFPFSPCPVFYPFPACFALFGFFPFSVVLTLSSSALPDLCEGVTDCSFQALAEAGCGKNLTSLSLMCEFFLFFLLLLFFFCPSSLRFTAERPKGDLACSTQKGCDGCQSSSVGGCRVRGEADIADPVQCVFFFFKKCLGAASLTPC